MGKSRDGVGRFRDSVTRPIPADVSGKVARKLVSTTDKPLSSRQVFTVTSMMTRIGYDAFIVARRDQYASEESRGAELTTHHEQGQAPVSEDR